MANRPMPPPRVSLSSLNPLSIMRRIGKQHLIATFIIASCASSTGATPTFDTVKREFRSSDTLILDRQGELLHRLRTDATVRRGQWLALAEVSAFD